MTKNQTQLIVKRAQVTNDVRFTSAAKRASYRRCMLSAALAALFSVAAWAQTQLATVSGTITDASGAVVPGVSITIANQATGLKRSALTDAAGEYRFAGLPTGRYSLRIEKAGFQSQTREGVELSSTKSSCHGGNGDAVFKDAAGNFVANTGQILTTVGTGRELQLIGRFTF